MGSSATNAVPMLVSALSDKNPDVRWRASEALGMIGVDTDEVTSSLDELIHDKCDYVCEAAIMAIEQIKQN